MASSLLAIYGLRVLKNAFDAALPEFRISGKFLCVQLLLLLTIFTSILLNILVVTGVIECDNLFSSKSRGDSKLFTSHKMKNSKKSAHV